MTMALDTDLYGNGGLTGVLKWFSVTVTNASSAGEDIELDCNEIVHAFWHGAAGVALTWAGDTLTATGTAGTEDGTAFVLAR